MRATRHAGAGARRFAGDSLKSAAIKSAVTSGGEPTSTVKRALLSRIYSAQSSSPSLASIGMGMPVTVFASEREAKSAGRPTKSAVKLAVTQESSLKPAWTPSPKKSNALPTDHPSIQITLSISLLPSQIHTIHQGVT